MIEPLFPTFVRSLRLLKVNRIMKYMAKCRYVALALCAVIVLQGCDWIKAQLGMPTSEDINRMKIEIQRQEMEKVAQEKAREQRVKDSLEAIAVAVQEPAVEGYYVVLGAFKDHANADKFEAVVKKNGYSPEKILMKNGFMMVAVGGFSSFNSAHKEMVKIGELDFCPYDMWVYAASQGLHQ